MPTKNILSLALLLLIICPGAFAQHITISGYISDSATGEKLIGAYVYDVYKKAGTTTNAYGFYSFSLNADTADVIMSFIGYRTCITRIIGPSNTTLNVKLSPAGKLNTITIRAARTPAIQDETQMSSVTIPVSQIKSIPAFMGEVDVMKVLQLLPGVSKGSDGSSGIYVRGGGPDENLILLDGVPVYNVNHLFGFFSVFNGDAINNVQLIKGGFPARYGGRLSSVIDINMKEGNDKKIHGEGGIGLIASRFTLEGPIKNENTTFIVSARRTYLDLLTRPFIRWASGGTNSVGYYFYDLNAKINHKFSDKDRIYLSTYMGRDIFSGYSKSDNGSSDQSRDDYSLGWGNITSSLRWNHLWTNKLFMNVTATYSRYNFKIKDAFTQNNNGTTQTDGIQYNSGIYDGGLKVDFDYLPISTHHVRYGINTTYHTFTPGVVSYKQSGSGSPAIDTSFGSKIVHALESYIYIEDDWDITQLFKLNAGLHASGFSVDNKFYTSLEPRLSARYLLTENFSVKASYARMAQYLHLLSNSTIGLPTDLWVPVTARIKPEWSDQYAIGGAYTLKKEYEISVEGYYKNVQNVIDYKDGASFLGTATGWEDKVTVGRGWGYGAEFLIQKKVGNTTGWIGYTLAWAFRQFPDKNFGAPYPYTYDRRHDISVVVSHKISNTWDVNMVWVYATGNALTLPTDEYVTADILNLRSITSTGTVQNFAHENNFRMPAYNRMDISFNKHIKKKWGEVIHNFSIYNVYNHYNAFFVYIYQPDQNVAPVLRKVVLFPIIPSYTWNFKF